jgi:nucleoside-diphosphate-sugar epimerase
MRILVTGANGFVGAPLVREIHRLGLPVLAAVRTPSAPDSLPSVVEEYVVGALEVAAWDIALNGVDCIVHCASRAHVMSEQLADPLVAYREVNVAGTLRLAKAAAAAGVKRFIFISSVGVHGNKSTLPIREVDTLQPHNAYSVSKMEAEQRLHELAEKTDMTIVVIRPPLVYGHGAPGNFGILARWIRRGWPLPLGAVHNLRSLVALDNLVNFIVTCVIHPQAANQTFLVSDGKDLSTTELAQGIAQAAGVPALLLPVPVWALQVGASLLGKGDTVQRLCGNLQIDISKARNFLDWVPPVSVEEGLRRAMAV